MKKIHITITDNETGKVAVDKDVEAVLAVVLANEENTQNIFLGTVSPLDMGRIFYNNEELIAELKDKNKAGVLFSKLLKTVSKCDEEDGEVDKSISAILDEMIKEIEE